jgi:thioredoxin-related protein
VKKTWVCAVLSALLVSVAQAQSWVKNDKEPVKTKGWLDDFEQAKKEAAAFKQPVFAFFTGSDWCGWCIRLKKEALDTQAFGQFAADNLILFEADFPQDKALKKAVKEQNAKLAARYGVRGYPTVFLLDAAGKPLGETGYQEGGAEAYVKHLTALLGQAGVKVIEKSAAGKPLPAYEKMKAEKAAQAK